MRLLAISCWHGKLPNGFKDYVKKNKIDMIVSLGDHCDGDETRSIQFKNWDFFKGKEYYAAFKEFLGEEEYRSVFERFALSGKKLLEELDSLGLATLVLHGNNDFLDEDRKKSGLDYPTLEEICTESENLMLLDGQKFEIQGYRIAGCGGYRDFRRMRKDMSEKDKAEDARSFKEYTEKLQRVLSGWKNTKTILVCHDQPRDTDFDMVNYPASPAHGSHVGDDAITEAIKEYRPLACIAGHMHEHHGISKLGDTLLVAAGFGQKGQCAILELPDFKITTATI